MCVIVKQNKKDFFYKLHVIKINGHLLRLCIIQEYSYQSDNVNKLINKSVCADLIGDLPGAHLQLLEFAARRAAILRGGCC